MQFGAMTRNMIIIIIAAIIVSLMLGVGGYMFYKRRNDSPKSKFT